MQNLVHGNKEKMCRSTHVTVYTYLENRMMSTVSKMYIYTQTVSRMLLVRSWHHGHEHDLSPSCCLAIVVSTFSQSSSGKCITQSFLEVCHSQTSSSSPTSFMKYSHFIWQKQRLSNDGHHTKDMFYDINKFSSGVQRT